jgi:hypothetical protein
VNGTLARSSSAATGSTVGYDFAHEPGISTVSLEVLDNSPILHPTHRNAVAATRTWTFAMPRVQPVSGEQLTIKDNVEPRKRKIVFSAKDPGVDLTGVDPVSTGAYLQVYNSSGSGDAVCIPLPAVGGSWQSKGTGPKLTFVYKDKSGANGPCASASLKNGKHLKVACGAKLRPISYSLDEPAQTSVAIRFETAAVAYCAQFGGNVKKDSGTDPPNAHGKGVFQAVDAPAPVACPAPPTSCP